MLLIVADIGRKIRFRVGKVPFYTSRMVPTPPLCCCRNVSRETQNRLTSTQKCVRLAAGGDIVSNLDELEMKRLQITLRSDVLERLDVLALEMGVKRSVVLSLLINEKWKEEHTD